jgi:nicotinamidase-related amidase
MRLNTLMTVLMAALVLPGVVSAAQAASQRAATRVLDELTPDESVVLLIDYQPQFAFSTRSIDIDSLVNNAVALTKAARAFNVPVITTTVTARSFGGPMLAPIASVAGVEPIDRSVINPWRDERVVRAIKASGRKKLVMAGLWTDNCVMLPALSALAEGFDVYVVTDASGDYDSESHERAVQRLVQAGAVPITWLPVMLEWQADWAHTTTSGAVGQILREHAAAIGAGAQYLQSLKTQAPEEHR